MPPPHTLAMITDLDRKGARQGFNLDFVNGVVLDNTAKAFYFEDVASKKVVNELLEELPNLIWAVDNTYHVFVRQVGDQVLSFENRNGALFDLETDSIWDPSRGLATGVPLRLANCLQGAVIWP